ncbi:hypothetical protein SAMN04488516_11711 [Desulfonauticus submarinus]|uniref:Uncharacterized protein n=1 Tax=Desulfonauticus submarinus TaxID=206665 RepID=A0A1H0G972_9BACT|nr:helix-turn-helix domain-containing protein [Desulfonauticus submarinus]SDO03401.1 hypothetical protein SAMN04488516_11711 [Desulfonauticus submarinus]
MNKYRKNSARVKMWEAIRGLSRFTAFDVCQLSGASYQNVKRYLRALELAGYIETRGKNGRWKIYKLIKDTGFRAPIQKEIRCLFDPNTGELWVQGYSYQGEKR